MKTQSGMTFIEILVSLVVVSILAAGLGGSMTALSRDATLGREMTQASFLLQAMAEEILGQRRAAPTGFDQVVNSFVPVVVGGKVFARTASVSQGVPGLNGCPVSAADGECKEVILTVTAPSRAVLSAMLLLTDYD